MVSQFLHGDGLSPVLWWPSWSFRTQPRHLLFLRTFPSLQSSSASHVLQERMCPPRRDLGPFPCNRGLPPARRAGGQQEAEWTKERMQIKGQSVRIKKSRFSPDNLLFKIFCNKGLTLLFF